MAVSVEHRAPHHAIDDLRAATTSPPAADESDGYCIISWDDIDDEGVGGFRGGSSSGSTGRKGR